MYELIFVILAVITIASAFVTVFVRNIAYAAFSLMFTFFGVSGIYVMLGADFVGVTQLLIYVGGILVLFLFGMMLTSNIDKLNEERPSTGRLMMAAASVSAIAAMLLRVVWTTPLWVNAKPQPTPKDVSTTSWIGELFMGDYALLFIVSSIAILVALVGAAVIARNDKNPTQEPAN